MNPHILEIFQRSHAAGPALFPPGHRVLEALKWDGYCNWYEIDSRQRYIFKIMTSMVGGGEDVVSVKQVINLDGDGLHRKHEVAFSFSLDNLSDIEIDSAPSHPGIRSMNVPYSFSPFGQEPGDPACLNLSFSSPVQARRWSCMPITAGVIEQELALYNISVWFASAAVASFAEEKLLLAKTEWIGKLKAFSSPSGGVVIPAPQFAEIPSTPPGGIVRGGF